MKRNKFIFWTPRIILIIFALFLVIFSFDVFDSCNSFLSCTLALFMHNLPSIILLIILLISWKYELFGGIIFTIFGIICLIVLLYNLFLGYNKGNPIFIIGSIVFLLIGILFLIGWKQKK